MIDDLCRQLCATTPKRDWVSLEDLEKILIGQNIPLQDAREIMNFMVKHLLETDETGGKVRLRQCFTKIFES